MSGCRAVSLCVLVAGLSGSPAVAQRGPGPDPLVREGVTVKLGPHTYAIPDGNVGGVPNVGIVVGTRATLVIDPGMGRRNGEAVLREVAKVSRNTEVYLASTHFHVEHTTGLVAFPASAKYVNGTAQEAEFAEGGMRLVVVGPTHTRGDTGFFVEGDAVIFAGDVVMNNSFVSANQNSSMKAWLAAFDLFSSMKPATIVPAHGDVGPASMLPALQEAVLTIQARARELKAQGRTADETATTVQTEMVAKLPTWPRANGVAALARSAYAEAP